MRLPPNARSDFARMVPAKKQIAKLEREIEKLLADSTARLEKEHALFLKKLARIDARIEALVTKPPRKPRRKRPPPSNEQLTLIQ